jgi:predicted phage terminase large subunit-like protein
MNTDFIDLDAELEDRQEYLETLLAIAASRSLKHFVYKTWSIIEPDVELKWNWHLDELCKELEAITHGDKPDDDHLIVNVPPGTMKSLLISVFWCAWEWSKNPRLRYLCASYGGHLSIRDNVRLRQIIESPWYRKHFPDVRLKDDQNAKERFNTTAGGWRIATSVGGVGTGEHPDRIVIDDPLTAQQARSVVERMSVNDWLDRTMSSRGVARGVRMVLVMQRLHEEDPCQHLMEKGGWRKIVFPMRYEPFRAPTDADPGFIPDPRDHRTVAGELLWPDLFTEPKVRKLEIALGPYGTAGQLQQRPSPEGGGLFKREWFKFAAAAPKLARRVRGWDTASTEEGGDWTVGVKISEPAGPRDKDTGLRTGLGTFFIEHVQREQLSPAGVDALIKQTAEADGKMCSVREEKEQGSSGRTVVDARAKMLKGFDYKFVQVSGDKVTRSKPFRAQVEAGNVYIVRTGDESRDAWIETYISELTNFPTGKKDDQVDGSSCSFNAVLLEPFPEEEWVTW